jgi:hypothetical protein
LVKLNLLEIIKLSESRGLFPGVTLNEIARWFGVPNGWTFPWKRPFGGSIEYGDLKLGLTVKNRDVIVTSFSICLWDICFPGAADPYRVPKPKPSFRRNSRVDMQGIRSGMSQGDVQIWLQQEGIGFSEFEQVYTAYEESRQIIANNNTLFSFCRGIDGAWLMDVVVFDKSHMLWPVKHGVGEVGRIVKKTRR